MGKFEIIKSSLDTQNTKAKKTQLLTPRINEYLLGVRNSEENRGLDQWTRNMRTKPDRKDHRFHPSSIDQDFCGRAWVIEQYGIAEPEEGRAIDSSTMRIFELGNAVHDMLQSWFAGMGILYGRWVCPRKPEAHSFWGTSLKVCPLCKSKQYLIYAEVPVDHARLNYLGHCDGEVLLADIGRVQIELKSSNSRIFDTLALDPMEKHRHQAVQYMYVRNQADGWMTHLGETPLTAPYDKIVATCILYYEKDGSRLREHIIWASDAVYDDVMTPKLEAFEEIKHFNPKLLKTLPVRVCANHGDGEMRKCPFVTACFGTLPPLKKKTKHARPN